MLLSIARLTHEPRTVDADPLMAGVRSARPVPVIDGPVPHKVVKAKGQTGRLVDPIHFRKPRPTCQYDHADDITRMIKLEDTPSTVTLRERLRFGAH